MASNRVRKVNVTKTGVVKGQPHYRLRWRYAGVTQSVMVRGTAAKREAVAAIEDMGCNITQEAANPQLWMSPARAAEVTRDSRTFLAVATDHIDAKAHASDHSKDGYHGMLRGSLIELHRLPVEAITAADVNRWSRAQLASGLAPATVKARLVLITSTLAYAHRKGLRADNPTDDIVVPSLPRHAELVLTDAQVSAIVAHTKPETMRAMFTVMAETGIRGGEARALRVSDVDLANGVLYVNGSTIGGTRKLGPGKGAASIRKIDPLWPSTIAALAPMVEGRDSTELVWPGRDGGPMAYETVRLAFNTTRDAAGAPVEATLHQLRHVHLSALANDADVPDEAVRDRAGHYSYSVTERYYVRTNAEGRAAVAAHGAKVGRARLRAAS